MGETCVCLPNLTPARALAKLAAASSQDGVDPQGLLAIAVRSTPTAAGHARATLVIPQGQGKRRPRQTALIKAIDEAGDSAGSEMGEQHENDMGFLAGCAWLLANSAGTGSPAQIDDSRFLIVGRGLSDGQAVRVLTHLRLGAVGGIRVAIERNSAGVTYHLFAARSEAERGGTIRPMIEGGDFQDCQVLVAFVESGASFFLPDRPPFTPSVEALRSFGALFGRIAPHFGPAGGNSGERFGIAVFPDPPNTRHPADAQMAKFALIPLAQAQFEDDLAVVNGFARNMTFETYDLAASREALETLAQKIRAADPPIGYQLRLISSPEYDVGQMPHEQRAELLRSEQQRLLEALNDVQYDLQNQEALLQRRPMLLRFTPAQLPAMADELRSFPMSVMREGQLLYGFQATRRFPAGMHFLLIWPDRASMDLLDPLLKWQTQDGPVRFWLDPQWARYYYTMGNEHLVFVPHRTVLFPPVHAWDRSDMDRHWEDAMRLFLKESEAGEVPDYPRRYYVCEEVPGARPHVKSIDVTVLNADLFAPLRMRLGWLNNHLLVINRIGIERYIEQMADGTRQVDLAETIAQRAAAAKNNFQQEVVAARQDLLGVLNQLLADVTSEMSAQVMAMRSKVEKTRAQIQSDTQAVQQATDDTNRTHEEMRRLQARLKTLHQTHAAIQRREADLKRLERQTNDEAAKVEAAVLGLKARVDAAARQRYAIEQEVKAEIQLLQRTRDTLQQQLDQLDRQQP